ncbi:hypothetical protein BC941DRAFT_421152 [Chlamydoabsidia padenii]|nr:hypothetical protein BC941DRAFT_421152 [Chlamydoabsidia padenii]
MLNPDLIAHDLAQAQFVFECKDCGSDNVDWRYNNKARCFDCGYEFTWEPVKVDPNKVLLIQQQRLQEATLQSAGSNKKVQEWMEQIPKRSKAQSKTRRLKPRQHKLRSKARRRENLLLPKRRKVVDEIQQEQEKTIQQHNSTTSDKTDLQPTTDLDTELFPSGLDIPPFDPLSHHSAPLPTMNPTLVKLSQQYRQQTADLMKRYPGIFDALPDNILENLSKPFY